MSNKPETDESISKKYGVSIREPKQSPVGITVFLPGTSLGVFGPKLENYESTIDVLLEMNQFVIGFNQLSPNPLNSQGSHNKMAESVRDAVAAICALNKYPNLENKGYCIVGHSLGGKVALMVAAKFDKENVDRVLALDPVDDNDPQFTTNPPKINLGVASASIYLRQSARGMIGVSKERNAEAIKKAFPDKFKDDVQFVFDAKAAHMSYTDETNEASAETRKDFQAFIRNKLFFDCVDQIKLQSKSRL